MNPHEEDAETGGGEGLALRRPAHRKRFPPRDVFEHLPAAEFVNLPPHDRSGLNIGYTRKFIPFGPVSPQRHRLPEIAGWLNPFLSDAQTKEFADQGMRVSDCWTPKSYARDAPDLPVLALVGKASRTAFHQKAAIVLAYCQSASGGFVVISPLLSGPEVLETWSAGEYASACTRAGTDNPKSVVLLQTYQNRGRTPAIHFVQCRAYAVPIDSIVFTEQGAKHNVHVHPRAVDAEGHLNAALTADLAGLNPLFWKLFARH